jgi:pimeloyl-ACP methyl ester carboxylesterase
MSIKDMTNQTIKLNDGRTLGYAECGDPQGKPIIEFHGNPSSRLGGMLFDEAARKLGIRVIGIDRPGREVFRSGTRGVALDYALNVKPWGFELEDISTEIHLWHGEDDTIVPPAMGRYLAKTIPNCHARFLPGEGHFSLLPNYAVEILQVLVF